MRLDTSTLRLTVSKFWQRNYLLPYHALALRGVRDPRPSPPSPTSLLRAAEAGALLLPLLSASLADEMAAVVTATAMPMQQQAMMATVPDGVAPGGQFMLQAPDGSQVLVTCPTENKAGDQVQFMVPMAAPMPQATATAMPAMQAQPMGAPMAMPMQMNAGGFAGGLPMYPGVTSHPAARGSSEMTQNATLSLPQPIKKTQWGNSKPVNPDKLQGSFHTGSQAQS